MFREFSEGQAANIINIVIILFRTQCLFGLVFNSTSTQDRSICDNCGSQGAYNITLKRKRTHYIHVHETLTRTQIINKEIYISIVKRIITKIKWAISTHNKLMNHMICINRIIRQTRQVHIIKTVHRKITNDHLFKVNTILFTAILYVSDNYRTHTLSHKRTY